MSDRRDDAARFLASAILGQVPGARLIAHRETPWASATFVGTRHELRVECRRAEEATAAAARLPEAEFAVRGHLVAEVAARATGVLIELDVLTLVAA